jgi:uncharacterized protein YidB (DUF937 family)
VAAPTKGVTVAGLEQLVQQLLGGSSAAGGLDVGKLTALAQPLLQQLQSGGGLQGVLSSLQQAGLGDQVGSWLGTGANASVDPQALGDAVGEAKVDALAQESGLSPDEVKTGLSELLPGLVNQLSPTGSLPTNASDLTGMLKQVPGGEQLSGMLGGLLGGQK